MNQDFLNDKIFTDQVEMEASRTGFGRGLKKAGEEDEKIVAMSADLTESTQAIHFAEAFPARFVEIGIAEQNMICIAAGMAQAGKIPFATSFSAFNPGRNWEQIKTTAALNNQPVKVVGTHSGLTDGPDGATHQMMEDIAIMRVVPNMVVVVPCDSLEAEKATLAIAKDSRPTYLRLAREKTPIMTKSETPFEIGKSYVLKKGKDLTICATGTMTYNALAAAKILEDKGVDVEVVHAPTIKPFDNQTLLESVKKTGRVITIEEAQAAGGLGGVVAELLADELPAPMKRLGMQDRFGESGDYAELVKYFELDPESIAKTAEEFVKSRPQYKQGF